jgi:3-oxoacyl-[acyl-carrier protein] reductase
MLKKVLITGASGGIGEQLAKKFHDEGYFVILSGRNSSRLQKVTKSFKKNFDIFSCDLDSSKDIKVFCKNIENKHKRVDILINNAGITDDSLFIRMDEKKWDNVLNTNLKSNFYLTNFFIKGMLKNKWGRIINITSVVCHTGNPGQSNYCASKAAIVGMSKSIAMEVAKRGITVNCISPGFIETSMTESLNEKQKENILSNIPMAKIGKPEDVANSAIFLASDNSEYITGQTIHVNGGITMI